MIVAETEGIFSIRWNNDGRLFVIGCSNNSAKVVDFAQEKVIFSGTATSEPKRNGDFLIRCRHI